MLVFVIGALRAIIEMLGLCLIGQAALYLLAGEGRRQNTIYLFFELVTRGPRQLVALLLPKGSAGSLVGLFTFILLFILWVGLAWLRKFL